MKINFKGMAYLAIFVLAAVSFIGIVSAANKSAALTSDKVAVINNAGIPDTITVSGLSSADTIKVYLAQNDIKPLASANVAKSKTSVNISVKQLGASAGYIFVSVTKKDMGESDRLKIDYVAEQISLAPAPSYLTVTNYAGLADTITIRGLAAGDVFKAYDSADKGKLLGSATNTSSKTNEKTIKVSQLSPSSGSVYITVTTKGKSESERTKVSYSAEPKSSAPLAENISVTNNAGSADVIQVVGLLAADIVKAYDSNDKGKLLGSATATKTKKDVIISVKQLAVSTGSVYITITGTGKAESSRTKADYNAESRSDTLKSNQIAIINNKKIADTIRVSGISAKDVIKVYDSAIKGKLLGSATAASAKSDATITIKQLGASEGSVYVTVTKLNKSESDRLKADYSAEPK